MNQPIELSNWQLAVAVSLILVSAAISAALHLGLGRRLLLAAIRTTVQLLLIGFVLEWLFKPGRAWYFVLAMMSAMTFIAGISAVRRTERRYVGIWIDSIISLWATSWLMTAVALFGVVQIQGAKEHPSWYNPQYAIPLLGMILGNTLSAAALSLDRVSHELVSKRDQVETLLALGATALGSGPLGRAAGRPRGNGPHDQHDDGCRRGQPARHDDRPDYRRAGPQPGRSIPDHDHVPDCRGHGLGHIQRGAAVLPADVQFGPPVSARPAVEGRIEGR